MLALAGCGGGGSESNPLDNPPLVNNPGEAPGQKLSYAYFQRCVYPILVAALQVTQAGVVLTKTCAAASCHDDTHGAGGAFRVIPGASTVDVTNPVNTAAVIRATAMYRSFYSAQGQALPAAPAQSALLSKPLLRNVTHGGGQVFFDELDPNARRIQYWIANPVPSGDEFNPSANGMFTPADPNAGACNTQ